MLNPTSSAVSPIPVQLTRFVGRDRELSELTELIRSTRLLTLTGAGGSGKTRLALEVTGRLGAEVGRLAWVDLAGLADGQLVVPEIAATLRVAEAPGRGLLDTLCTAIGSDTLFLALDNCEHVVDAAAAAALSLLQRCEGLTILATSREALGVPGEVAWLVPSLADQEAVQLFHDRARAVSPAFVLRDDTLPAVQAICRRLDGIPLAIELAAARVRVLSPEQIAARLDDAFRLLASGSRTAVPRHRTLKSAMDWSYRLLAPLEQRLLRRLAGFVGGFSLEAAEAVCAGEGLDPEDVLDGITALADKSLLLMETADGEARYRLLETVRQYADERLAESGESDTIRARHARFYVGYAQEIEPHIFGGAFEGRWLAPLHREAGNFTAVVRWAEARPERTSLVLELGSALHWYWFSTGQFREGLRTLRAALARGGDVDPLVRARAALAASVVMVWAGEHDGIFELAAEAVPVIRDRGDRPLLAYALAALGVGHLMSGDPPAAAARLDEALGLIRELKHPVRTAFTLFWRGNAALAAGDRGLARTCFEEASALGRAAGNGPSIAHPLVILGQLAMAESRVADAFGHLAEALEIHRDLDDAWGMSRGLDSMAAVAAALGRADRAATLLAAAHALRLRIGMDTHLSPDELADRETRRETVARALGSAFESAWRAGMAMSPDAAVALAIADPPANPAEHAAGSRPHPAPAPAPDAAAPDLEVAALGPLTILRSGRPIDPARWGSARPRELLVYLLLHPDGVTKEQVGLHFWPEATPVQLRNSFHVTLHRLRRALGETDWIVLEQERYRVAPSVRVAFDVALFIADLDDAMRALTRQRDGAAGALERALARYRGDLLDGEPAGDWHLQHREHLRRRYLDGMSALGEQYLKEERFAKGAEAFRLVLLRDELREPAWRRLMLCHARLGERAQALKLYQQLTETLARELGAEPDRETTRLYRELAAT